MPANLAKLIHSTPRSPQRAASISSELRRAAALRLPLKPARRRPRWPPELNPPLPSRASHTNDAVALSSGLWALRTPPTSARGHLTAPRTIALTHQWPAKPIYGFNIYNSTKDDHRQPSRRPYDPPQP